VRGLQLWSTPRQVLIYVLIVDAAALAATAATTGMLPVTATDWTRLAVLLGCAIAHVEGSRRIERTRKLTAGTGPFVDGLTPWHWCAVLVLPASLASVLVVALQTYVWFRVWRGRRPLYRWVFSAATVLLATQASALVLAEAPGPHPGIPLGWIGLGFVIVAAVLRWLINYSLILGAILASSPDLRASQLLSKFNEQIVEAGAMAFGLAAAGLLEFDVRLLVVGMVGGLIAFHRTVLLGQFRDDARTDSKTGLHTPAWWHQIATSALQRAAAARTTVGVLMLDLDHFKRINDTYGHVAGDRVLRAVADAITEAVRSYDAACRWGGEEFAVLLPDVTTPELHSVAERIRRQVRALVVDITLDDDTSDTVTDLTISIGGAIYPRPAITDLTELQVAADTALYDAKRAGRDRVHITGEHASLPAPNPREAPRQEHHPL
jgi:diguanylate cyclase (GGDEF)-like protein